MEFSIVENLRMEFAIVENLSGLQENMFNLSRGPQLHFCGKNKNWSNFIKFTDFPLFPLFGVPWAAVIIIRFPQLLSAIGVLVASLGHWRCQYHGQCSRLRTLKAVSQASKR